MSSTDSAMSNLKQCLHYDPDSKECFAARRLVKNFGKTFDKLENLLNSEDWKGVINLLEKDGFANKFNQVLDAETAREILGLPSWLALTPPRKSSPRREVILRGLCKAYVRIGQPKKGETWCQALGQRLGGEEDSDALLGQGEALLADEEYEDAVRVMEKAWDACGRKDRFFQQRLIRAQKLLKQSKQKDYYKVLGVSRDADKKTIKKAL
jgi:DnaJ family protein C protein 3